MTRALASTAAVAALGLASVVVAQAGWALDVSVSSGPMTVAEASASLESRLGDVAECAPGAGPYRLVYSVSVGTSGGVRSATADRSASAALAPPRVVRCVRHVLEELDLPEHEDASRVEVVLSLGEGGDPGGSVVPASPSAPSGPVRAPSPSAPVGGAPIATAAAGVSVGTITGGVAAHRVVVDGGRAALAACYEAARSESPALAGAGTLHVTIEPDGHVSRAMFAGGEALASAMAICLGAAARAWSFVPATTQTLIEITLTFSSS